MNAGQWKRPGDATKDKDRLPYWLWMAKLAEKGKISCIFLADAYGGHETYGGSMDAVLRGGTQAGYLDVSSLPSSFLFLPHDFLILRYSSCCQTSCLSHSFEIVERLGSSSCDQVELSERSEGSKSDCKNSHSWLSLPWQV